VPVIELSRFVGGVQLDERVGGYRIESAVEELPAVHFAEP
jgi:hypothetical protein